jgi:nucleoside-diphosphate-sugar epimerase
MNKLQTILGGGGVIANELAKNLSTYTANVRIVSRSNSQSLDASIYHKADLLIANEVDKAVAGSDIDYLTAGLKYSAKVWKEQWPILMKNTLDACRKHNAKLVFFDNVYPYGKVKGWMTEDNSYAPCSAKGEVRASIANMLMDAVESGQIQALIARSADFYGPNAKTSFANALIFDKLSKNQKPSWMISDEFNHSFTFTPDAGKATAILGNSPEAYDQIWHLPTDKKVLSGKEFIAMAAEIVGADEENYSILKKWMLSMAGLFNSVVKENMEMLYQFDSDYLFDSSKFEKAYEMQATPYKLGMIEIFKQLHPNANNHV